MPDVKQHLADLVERFRGESGAMGPRENLLPQFHAPITLGFQAGLIPRAMENISSPMATRSVPKCSMSSFRHLVASSGEVSFKSALPQAGTKAPIGPPNGTDQPSPVEAPKQSDWRDRRWAHGSARLVTVGMCYKGLEGGGTSAKLRGAPMTSS